MQLESVLDSPREGLDPVVWSPDEDGSYVLSREAGEKIRTIIEWIVREFGISEYNANVTGSITSNQWKEDSDIDVHVNSPEITEESQEGMNRDLRERFARFSEDNPDAVRIGEHPLEVYFQWNPYQDLMSVGCYDVNENRWLVGPELRDVGYDPVSDYWDEDMALVEEVVEEVRGIILEVRELCISWKMSGNAEFREERFSEISEFLERSAEIFEDLKAFRTSRSTPRSEADAMRMRASRKWKVADSAFKMLDKLGYLRIFKTFAKCVDSIGDGASEETVVETALSVVEEVFGNGVVREDGNGDSVPGMPGWRAEDLKSDISSWIEGRIEEYQLDIELIDLALFGSRTRGDNREDSDLDCMVYYRGTRADGKYAREDHIYSMLNDSPECEIDGILVDFWPIRDEESGDLQSELRRAVQFGKDHPKGSERVDEGLGKYLGIAWVTAMLAIQGVVGEQQLRRNLRAVPQQKMSIGTKEVQNAIKKSAEETKEQERKGGLLEYQAENLLARTLYAEAGGEKDEGIDAVMTVVYNRTGGDPKYLLDVLKEPSAFECWSSMNWGNVLYLPPESVLGNRRNLEIWSRCLELAKQYWNGTFDTRGKNWNSYMNKKKSSKKNVDTWGKKMTNKVGRHHFGYLREHDPKYVVPGTMLPRKRVEKSQDPGKTYTVKKGDYLQKIAKDLGTTVKDLVQKNQSLKNNPNLLKPGQVLSV